MVRSNGRQAPLDPPGTSQQRRERITQRHLPLDQGRSQEDRGCEPFGSEKLLARGGLEIGPRSMSGWNASLSDPFAHDIAWVNLAI
jgi:hypothetical protein